MRIKTCLLVALLGLFSAASASHPKSLYLRLLAARNQADAEKAVADLESGQTFAAVAARYSIDPSRERGGYLGLTRLDRLSRDFQQRAAALKPDSYSPIFQSGGEYILLYRMGRDFRSRAVTLQEQGDEALRKGNAAEAVRLCSEAVAVDPELARAYLCLGIAYGESGQRRQELESYRLAVQVAPDFEQAHYNLGQLLMAGGDLPGAIRSFQRAVEIKPDFVEALANLSALYLGVGQETAALETARQAVTANPLLASAHYNLGLAQASQDLEAALKSFEMAATLDPAQLQARLNGAIALARLGRLEAARDRLNELLTDQPDYAAARSSLEQVIQQLQSRPVPQSDETASRLFEQGRQAWTAGRIEAAAQLFEKAGRLDPQLPELKVHRVRSLLALGQLQLNNGRWQTAVQLWEAALRIDPASGPVLEGLAEVLTVRGAFTAAESYLEQAEKIGPQTPRLTLLRARLAYERRDFEKSVSYLEKLTPLALDPATALRMVEQLFLLDLDGRALELTRQLELEERQKLDLSSILIRAGHFAEAEKELRSISVAGARLQLAELYARQLRFQEAIPLLEEAIREYPTNWQAMLLLGRIYVDAGQAEEALTVLAGAERLQPENVNLLLQIGLAAWQAGQRAEAETWLMKGLALEPAHPLLNYEYGRLLLEEGQTDAALEFLLAVLKQEPDHVRTHYLLGTLYRQKGDLATADHYFSAFNDLKERLEKDRAELKAKKSLLKGGKEVP